MTVKQIVLEAARDRYDKYRKTGYAGAMKGWYAEAVKRPEPSVRRAINQLVAEGEMRLAPRPNDSTNYFEVNVG